MYKYLLSSMVAGSLFITGCASTPENRAEVEAIKSKFSAASANADVQRYAPIPLEVAEEYVNRLDRLASNNAKEEVIEQQIYLTDRKIDIALEDAKTNKYQEQVGSSELRRKNILLEARAKEAAKAKKQAEMLALRAKNAEAKIERMQDNAKKLELEIENLTTKETERGLILTLENILFATNKTALKPGSERTIQKVAGFLNQYPDRSIMIEGFTDSTGSESYNQQLSEQRASAVKNALLNYGLSGEKVRTAGFGEQYPVASNNNAAGRQQNRRVEIVIANESNKQIKER